MKEIPARSSGLASMTKPYRINRTRESGRQQKRVLVVDLCAGAAVFALIALLVYLPY